MPHWQRGTPGTVLLLFISHCSFLIAQETSEPVALPAYVAREEGTKPPAAAISRLDTEALDPTVTGPLTEISARIPNLSITSNSLRSFGDIYSIRGIGNTAFFSNPAVVLYVDNVAMGSAFSHAVNLSNIESIDIYRGPQGHLFGRNASAGVISIKTRRHEEEYRASASFRYGNYSSADLQFGATGPLQRGRLYFSLAGRYARRHGFLHNRTLDKVTDHRKAYGGHFNFYYRPSQSWEIAGGYNADRFDDGSQLLTPLGGPFYEVDSDFEGSTKINRNAQHLRLALTLPWGSLSSTTARQDWNLDPNALDLDLSPLPGFTSTIRQSQEQWTQEFLLRSPVDAARALSWHAGLFLLRAETGGTSVRTFFAPPLPFLVRQETVFDSIEENAALFARAAIAPKDKLELGLGLRIDHSRKSIDRTKTDDLAPPREITGEDTFTEFAPSFEFSYPLKENLRIFAVTALGIKPGGFSAFTDDPSVARFNSETVWSNQLGLAYSHSEKEFFWNLTGFWNEIDDYQVERTFTFTDYIVVNAEKARSQGVEFEISFRPRKGVQLKGSVGTTDFEFERYLDPFTSVSFQGNRAPFTPRYTANLGIRLESAKGLYGAVDFRAVGETFFDEANSPDLAQRDYSVVSLKTGLATDRLGIHIFALNLGDSRYYTSIVPDLNAGVPGDPFSYGFRATLDF